MGESGLHNSVSLDSCLQTLIKTGNKLQKEKGVREEHKGFK